MANQGTNKRYFGNDFRSHSLASSLHEKLIETRKENLKNIFAHYEGNDHRLEYVKSINDIDFIDDSHANSVKAVWYALESMTKPVTWIMNIGDIDEVTEDLLEAVDNKVERIVIQGVYNSEIIDFFSGLGKEVSFAMNLEDAVRVAFYSSVKGNVVLFSPGVSGRGMYVSYRERGEKFKNAIAQL